MGETLAISQVSKRCIKAEKMSSSWSWDVQDCALVRKINESRAYIHFVRVLLLAITGHLGNGVIFIFMAI